MTTPDTRPGPYYVTAITGGRYFVMAGPYSTHQAALDDVQRARDVAYQVDPRAWWAAWGTARIEGSQRAGRLNDLGLMRPPVHYRTDDGVIGYREGDVLVNELGERTRVVRDGRGLALQAEPPAEPGVLRPPMPRHPYGHDPDPGF